MSQVDSASMRGVARSMKRAVNEALDHWRYRSLVNSQAFRIPCVPSWWSVKAISVAAR
jgi:hypothetical protein